MITAALVALPELAISQALSISITPADHNGYHISCNAGADGAIDLSVTGGTAPYTYLWSTGETTQDVSGLRAGFISVTVRDAAAGNAREELTLTEPDKLEAEIEPFQYNTGYNISCHSCYNGSIAVTITGGVPVYTYAWADGSSAEDRTQLDAGSYQVDVTDANGCVYRSEVLTLTQPERDDWTKYGNAGTAPGTHFIGTTDNKDVVFKSNGAERLRLLANGDVKANALGFAGGYRPVFTDSTGTLRIGFGTDQMFPGRPMEPCCPEPTPWFLCGNNLCNDQFLGTNNDMPLRIRTNSVQRMLFRNGGRVGIGTDVSNDPVDGYRLFVEDGIVARDVLVTANNFPDYVFQKNYRLMPLDEVARYIDQHGHLPHMPSAAEVDANNGVEVGDLQLRLLRTVEEQQLYILQLRDDLQAMKTRLAQLEKR